MGTVATVCGYCGVGCGMKLDVADGTVTKATGRAGHPANHGRLCAKGNTTADMLRAGGRLTAALVRPDRAATAEPTRLDDAVPFVADKLSAIRDEHGPDAIALYVSGQISIYVCGNTDRMPRDVDGTTCGFIAEQSARSAQSAASYLQATSTGRRYLRDVY